MQNSVARPLYEIIGYELLCRSLSTEKIFLYVDRVKPYVSGYVCIQYNEVMKILKSGRAESYVDGGGIYETINEIFEEAHRGNVYIVMCGCAEVFRPYQAARDDYVDVFVGNLLELSKQAAFIMQHVPKTRLTTTHKAQFRFLTKDSPIKIKAAFVQCKVAPQQDAPIYITYLNNCISLLRLNDQIQLIMYSWIAKKLPYNSKKRPPEYNLIEKNLFVIILKYFGNTIV